MVSTAEHVRLKLKKMGVSCSLINGRFVKPVDTDIVDYLAENHRVIVTLEENVLRGRLRRADYRLRAEAL